MAITNREVYTTPMLPTLGAANSQFSDPTFGSRMVRVTDAAFATDLGNTDRSFHTSASGYQREWNTDSTKFWITASEGSVYLCSFNPATLATARIGVGLEVLGDLAWSDTDPERIYATTSTTSDHHTLVRLDTSTVPPTMTVIVDLDTITAGLHATEAYVGALGFANGNLFCIYGSTQDLHRYVVHYPVANPGAAQTLNTMTSGLMPLGEFFTLHSAQIDKSGRFISLIPGSYVGLTYKVYIWDTLLNTVTGIGDLWSGHEVLGYGTRINNDSIGTYDSRKWVLTPDLAAPTSNRVNRPGTILSPVVGGWGADHSCWHNATAAYPLVPFISGSYRYGDGPAGPDLDHLADSPAFLTPWRPWDDEIIGVATDGSDVVTRYCHTRSWYWRNVPTSEPASDSDIFYYLPRPNVSPDGRWVLFNSNWEKTLGTAAGTGIRRVDVFLVELAFGFDGRIVHPRVGRRFCAR